MAKTKMLFVATLLSAGSTLAAGPPGKTIYEGTCIACHGPDGKGALPGVSDFTAPKGPLAQSDDVLKKRIREGFQSPGSPMAMPPKGGNPNLTEKNIDDVLRYLQATFKR